MGGEEETRIPLLLVNEDGTALATQLTEALEGTVSLEVLIQSRESALTRFDDEEAPALVIIPNGYEASLLSGSPVELEIHKAPEGNEADAVEQAVLAALNKAVAPWPSPVPALLSAKISKPSRAITSARPISSKA